jgi:hypothetical protein
MEITYKYLLEVPPTTKLVKEFYDDFFENKFDDFMSGEIMLLISNDFKDFALLQFDIDFKRNETNEPNQDANKIFKTLNKVFKDYGGFDMEITPGGCHIVSKFLYKKKFHSMIIHKNRVKHFLHRVRNLDIDASFSISPMRRVGFEERRGFWFTPSSETTNALRNTLYTKTPPYSDIFWSDYIKSMVPKKKIAFSDVIEKLEEFHDILGGK